MTHSEKNNNFLELFEPNRSSLWRFSLALTRDKEDAKDLVSETALKAYESFENLRDKQAFKSYLFSIASRIYKRKIWRKRLFGAFDEERALEIPDPKDKFSIDCNAQSLYWALGKLSFASRQALIMFEISGFSIDEIAKFQNSSISAIKSRLKRGREKLKEILNLENSQSEGLSFGFNLTESAIAKKGDATHYLKN